MSQWSKVRLGLATEPDKPTFRLGVQDDPPHHGVSDIFRPGSQRLFTQELRQLFDLPRGQREARSGLDPVGVGRLLAIGREELEVDLFRAGRVVEELENVIAGADDRRRG